MGAYMCLICDGMFCHHSVNCYPHKDGLICEDCHGDLVVDISELTSKDIGRWVTYTPSQGKGDEGRIKSWNDKFVFVVYKRSLQWDKQQWEKFQDYTGCATDPEQLHFMCKEEEVVNV